MSSTSQLECGNLIGRHIDKCALQIFLNHLSQDDTTDTYSNYCIVFKPLDLFSLLALLNLCDVSDEKSIITP